jgi:hypothetical protein
VKTRRLGIRLAFVLLLAFGFLGNASATAKATGSSTTSTKASASSSKSSSSAASTGSITTTTSNLEGYAATSSLQDGTIVQLINSKANEVSAATQATLGHMYGVTVDPDQLSVTITNPNLQNEVYVATSGTYDTLVSNEGGTIATGDYLTLSSIDGVAMLAGDNGGTVFGRADTNFSGDGDGIGQATLKDTNGQTDKTVTLGLIPVTIDIEANPTLKSTKANLPKMLQRVGQAIAEKPVGPLRIYMSAAILVLTVIATISMVSSGVRTSIYSISRNPLSKGLVMRGLFTVILASFIILLIGLFAVYLLLKL